jgi:hypothetical protein
MARRTMCPEGQRECDVAVDGGAGEGRCRGDPFFIGERRGREGIDRRTRIGAAVGRRRGANRGAAGGWGQRWRERRCGRGAAAESEDGCVGQKKNGRRGAWAGKKNQSVSRRADTGA